MKRDRLAAVTTVVLLLAAGAGGWWTLVRNRGNTLTASSSQMALRWRGKFQGTMSLPATLNWCPVSRVGVLEAMSGDSGAAVVLYERDSLTSGPHVLLSPDLAGAANRPGAGFVVRWLRNRPDTAVTGFRSESGTVRITIANGKASGDVNSRMRSANGVDTLVVSAIFNAVPVVTTAKGCT